jgi:hypothetical protein
MVLYRCETWFLTLEEEHRLIVFETKVLRKISGLKRDEMMRGWRRLSNEAPNNFYSLLMIRLCKACGTNGGGKECI